MSKIKLVEDHLELNCDCGIRHVISESADGEPVCESIYRKDGTADDAASEGDGTEKADDTGTPAKEDGTEGAAPEPASASETTKILGLTFRRTKAA